ncbi:MAG: 5/3-nucleotidase SurE [Nocardioidaceae bacterium]|nr:5/3-nucleotidase SurE [Nocardioidaceae bacterium]
MRIVVTNDDGIDAGGIVTVAGELSRAGHDVVIVAPLTQASGSGSSLGSELDGRTVAAVSRTDHATGLRAIGVAAPPAYIALAVSRGWLGLEPDLLVSGINRGNNVGELSLFSGTLAAALTASLYGLPALAISCPATPTRYDEAASCLVDALPGLVESLPAGCAYNLNYPDAPLGDFAGWTRATLASSGERDLVALGDLNGVSVTLAAERSATDPTSDIALLRQRHGTFTPVSGRLETQR